MRGTSTLNQFASRITDSRNTVFAALFYCVLFFSPHNAFTQAEESQDSIEVSIIYGGDNQEMRQRYGDLMSVILTTMAENKIEALDTIEDSLTPRSREMLEKILRKGKIEFPTSRYETIIAYNDDFVEVRKITVSLTFKDEKTEKKELRRLFFGFNQKETPQLEYVHFDLRYIRAASRTKG